MLRLGKQRTAKTMNILHTTLVSPEPIKASFSHKECLLVKAQVKHEAFSRLYIPEHACIKVAHVR